IASLSPASCRGWTRASIHFRKKMDCRVKPGNDRDRFNLNEKCSKSACGRLTVSSVRPFLSTGAGERLHPRLVGGELGRRTGIDDAAVIEHVGVVGNLQTHPGILLDEEDRNPFAAHLRDNVKDLAHDQRSEPLRRLIENEQLGVEQQGAADRKHLLLATGKLAPTVELALGKPREKLVDAFGDPGTLTLQRYFQVLFDAEIGEDAPPLGNITDAQRGDAKRGPMGGLDTEDRDPALARRSKPHKAAQGGRLTRPVAAEERGDLALGDVEPDTLKDVALAVVGLKAFGSQRGGHAALPR